MDPAFWHQRWETNQLGFHKTEVHPMLATHIDDLAIPKGTRIFVPLCGKTVDIPWLLSQGYRVAAAELSEIAIRSLFDSMGIEASITTNGEFQHFQAPDIDIFVGDIFKLDAKSLGPVDAVYDRAALVALPDDMRARYAHHVPCLTFNAPQLLITFDYNQEAMDGPPFSVPTDKVHDLFGASFNVRQLSSKAVEGGLKGFAPADELVWLLS